MKFLTFIISIAISIISVQAGINLDKSDVITIDSVIYYQNPLLFEDEIIHGDYSPIWYPAYCAERNPSYFKEYLKEGPKFFRNSLNVTEAELQKKLTIIAAYSKREVKPLAYDYFIGEIWLTYKPLNQKYILTLDFNVADTIPNLDLNKIDTTLFYKPLSYYKKNSNEYNLIYKSLTSNFAYFYEDSIWKYTSTNHLVKHILNDKQKIYNGSFKNFIGFVNRIDTYTRSRVIDNKRIFETIRNTPDGPIIVNENHNKTWLQIKWLISIVSLLFLISIFLFFRKKVNSKHHLMNKPSC